MGCSQDRAVSEHVHEVARGSIKEKAFCKEALVRQGGEGVAAVATVLGQERNKRRVDQLGEGRHLVPHQRVVHVKPKPVALTKIHPYRWLCVFCFSIQTQNGNKRGGK